MTNAELFKKIFGIYAEEFWAYPKEEMLDWINSDAPDTDAEDLISRRAAIEALIAEGRNVDSRYLESERIIHESDAVEAISMLSPAQSERNKGKWQLCNILDYAQRPTGRRVLRCPFCEYLTDDFRTRMEYYHILTHFCPNCGAEMEGGEDA